MDTWAPGQRLLRAVLDTAADLADLKDTEAVLLSIVRRTRALVGTDLAYISLNDDAAGETYIRQAEGVVTEAYRHIRMPIGTGVLGKVAEGLSPFQSADYRADPSVSHLTKVDEAVRGEGVHAIMGAPLVVDGVALGALMVAERRPRTFERDEVAGVEMLARHAAIALRNAQRYTEALSAARAADEHRDQERGRLHALTRLTELTGRQCESLIHEPDMDAVLHRASGYFGVEVDVVHPQHPVAQAWRRSSASSGDPSSRTRCQRDPSGQVWTVTPLPGPQPPTEWLVVPAALGVHDAVALERTAQHVTLARRLHSLQERGITEAGTEALQRLIGMRAHELHRRRRQLAALEWDDQTRLHIAAVDVSEVEDTTMPDRVFPHILGVELVGAHGGAWFVIGRRADLPRRLETAVDRAAGGRVWHMAALAEGVPAGRLNAAVEQLQAGIALSRAAGGCRVVEASTVGAVGRLLAEADDASPPLGSPEVADPFAGLPAGRADALRQTALTYFNSGMNLTETARRTFLHRNTVKQRLQQLDELLGPGWNEPPRSLDLHVGLLLDEARTRSRP